MIPKKLNRKRQTEELKKIEKRRKKKIKLNVRLRKDRGRKKRDCKRKR